MSVNEKADNATRGKKRCAWFPLPPGEGQGHMRQDEPQLLRRRLDARHRLPSTPSGGWHDQRGVIPANTGIQNADFGRHIKYHFDSV